MKKQRIAILGSTGSVGMQALEVARQHLDKFEIIALTANGSWEELVDQINEFKPKYAVICTDDHFQKVKDSISSDTVLMSGYDALIDIVQLDEVDTVLNSLVGFAGFLPTLEAIKHNKKVALANKETLVAGGEIIYDALKTSTSSLIPIDSEHSAMLQCLVGEQNKSIEKIIITASGGPFREYSAEQMKHITVEQALKHPNWSMGSKITIDSATMMNKGLEIIEAKWLFDIPVNKIEPVIHPQSIIHSMITFTDGSTKAQLGPPDMKVPIIYALTFPERLPLDTPRMDWSVAQDLNFMPVNYNLFPCLKLAIDAITFGGLAPTVLNAANEIAVARFLNKEIDYIDIPKIVEKCLERVDSKQEVNIDSLIEINKETREFASQI
ncbi:MAG: 1-deoxy-D-xylulose-5-phosphate reductoisomerase [Balneolaceae bacterium]